MKSPEPKLELRNKNIAEQTAICRQIVRCASTLPEAAQESMHLPALRDHVEQTEELLKRLESLRQQTHATLIALRQQAARMRQRARVTRTTSMAPGTTGEDWLASGFKLSKTPSPVGAPGAPINARAEAGAVEGAIRLIYRRPVRRCFFEVQRTFDPNHGPWAAVTATCLTRLELLDQPRGRNLWYRIRALNRYGPGPWSKPVRAYA